jgi:cobalamin biosynthesis protein CobT
MGVLAAVDVSPTLLLSLVAAAVAQTLLVSLGSARARRAALAIAVAACLAPCLLLPWNVTVAVMTVTVVAWAGRFAAQS